ncbi:hypothetical protein LA080_009311 [Diaporthe eres]|nr:hypothetical protein LA080_009311 [Diaporthe eres]
MASAVETVYRPPELTSGTWTSWIPLVTPWSGHAPGCSTKFWQWNTDRSIVAWDPGFGISVSKDLRCVPEAATTAWDQDRLGSNSDTVVSIGPMTCPEAFSQVATSVMDASRTLVACCPSEYTFAQWKSPGNIGQCYSDVASGDILTVYTTDSKQSWVPDTRQINSSTTVIGAHINGWIFAEETPTPAAPAATESLRPGCSGGNTNSAVIFGIGVALAVVGVVVLAAGLVIMRSQIRLLSLSLSNEQSLVCRLQVVCIDEPPPYEALSYVWGNADDLQVVTIDGNAFRVTQNLYAALEHLVLPDGAVRPLWIDAICVNQGPKKSDLAERSHQVRLMSRIFSGATGVVAYLGKPCPGLFEAMEFLTVAAGGQQSLLDRLTQSGNYDVPQVCRALISFFTQPWWGRIWTVQEPIVARKVSFQFERLEIDSDMVRRGIYNIVTSRIRAPFEFADSGDPRDKIYSLMVLFPESDHVVNIDYTISTEQLFQNFTLAWIQKHQDLRWDGAFKPSAPSQADELASEGRPIETTVWIASLERSFIFTDGGHMGLAPDWCEIGDAIAIMGGGAVPMVLRPVGEVTAQGGDAPVFEVVGEAYVHGVMDGQAFGASGKSESDFGDIYLM